MLPLRASSIRCKIFRQVGNRIALYGHRRSRPRCTAGRLRIDACRMVNKVRGKTGSLLLLFRQLSGKLVDDRTDHL